MLPEVDSILTKLGIKFDIQISENPRQATACANSAASLGYTRVIALGGSGAINAIAAGLTNSAVILGIIPGGRGNDFFRSLGITGDLIQICKVAARGESRLLDVGILNDKLFINSAGFGFAAVVATEASQIAGNGRFAYYRAIYRAWKNYSAYDLSLRIDNIEIKIATSMIIAGIGKTTGGWLITPQALMDDGKFDVCVVEKAKRSKIFSLLLKFSHGNHLRLPEVRMYRCRQLEITGDKSLPAHYDGEIYRNEGERFMVKIEPAALRVATNLESGSAV
jgi:diacylglycerol kinase (ATP)